MEMEHATLLPTPPSTLSFPVPFPSTSASRQKGRLLLLLVAFLYGSLSVSLRAVYARPGPPVPSVLSVTRGWMTVLCFLPVVLLRWRSGLRSGSRSGSRSGLRRKPCTMRGEYETHSTTSSAFRLPFRLPLPLAWVFPFSFPSPFQSLPQSPSFYVFALELALSNVGTQGLLNIGLLTTGSARSAFFTQLSVVITPVLTYAIGALRGHHVVLKRTVWMCCFVALVGLCILSSGGTGSGDTSGHGNGKDGNASSFSLALSYGDWCCLGSAVCWSYYIYRLSDWGSRYDEVQTMLIKNILIAILYSLWAATSYLRSPDCGSLESMQDTIHDSTTNIIINNNNNNINTSSTFCLWEGWKDPVALSILLYTAASSGALCPVLQQTAQGHSSVPAAESNVLLSLEPFFAALLAALLLGEMPSGREWLGGACIVGASFAVLVDRD